MKTKKQLKGYHNPVRVTNPDQKHSEFTSIAKLTFSCSAHFLNKLLIEGENVINNKKYEMI